MPEATGDLFVAAPQPLFKPREAANRPRPRVEGPQVALHGDVAI